MNKFLYRSVGRFYLGDAEQQAQYVFQLREDAPTSIRRSFLISLEKDGDFSGPALSVAYDIQTIINSYWINTDKTHIDALVEYLEKWEEKDTYDGLIEERKKLTQRVLEICDELREYDHEEMKNWTPKEVVETP